CRRYQQLCCCFGTLCVILVLTLTNITMLTAENHNLTSLNEKLKEQRKNLTEIIETWNELNVSRAQWSIDQYCPKKNGGRSCTSCQDGWKDHMSSCYAYVDYKPPNQRTWEEARDDCRRKNSDLTVMSNQDEKVIEELKSIGDYVNSIISGSSGINGYWIGLRAVEGKWKWTDGSDLTDQTWIQQQPATDGYCVTSLNGRGWNTAICNDTNAWICEKKALVL
uniref:C-type lectin domain-containing protein n=1 Tax=Poecilia reticulata TaxID=8081 RepID=A0A3P9Q1N3_POERE